MNTFDEESELEPQCIDFISIITETKQAYLFSTKKGNCWLPKSQVTIEDTVAIVPDYIDVKYF